ncbi:hypothetical protein PoB_001253700 [Plakobranchus ocellatus]|uniref:Sushi domain-containing protein n=1 Tax=Plakobranchus ocellatus TaxID=259542 RepID=A0AAV3YV53_9GAST|nr:hypothetical protein PoB_001253700 [Plakobranchus ocellatus]
MWTSQTVESTVTLLFVLLTFHVLFLECSTRREETLYEATEYQSWDSRCGEPAPVPNVERKRSRSHDVTYTCREGTIFTYGNLDVSCEDDQYVNNYPACTVDCGQPRTWSGVATSFSTTDFGSTVTYTCDDLGESKSYTSTCASTGWDDIGLQCRSDTTNLAAGIPLARREGGAYIQGPQHCAPVSGGLGHYSWLGLQSLTIRLMRGEEDVVRYVTEADGAALNVTGRAIDGVWLKYDGMDSLCSLHIYGQHHFGATILSVHLQNGFKESECLETEDLSPYDSLNTVIFFCSYHPEATQLNIRLLMERTTPSTTSPTSPLSYQNSVTTLSGGLPSAATVYSTASSPTSPAPSALSMNRLRRKMHMGQLPVNLTHALFTRTASSPPSTLATLSGSSPDPDQVYQDPVQPATSPQPTPTVTSLKLLNSTDRSRQRIRFGGRGRRSAEGEADKTVTVVELNVLGQSTHHGLLECYTTEDGSDYKGRINTTAYGRECLQWIDQIDSLNITDSDFPDHSVEDALNYCR